MPEIWKKIDGYENYSVSKDGEIRNDKTGKILKKHKTEKGYEVITLWKDGIHHFRVHRLVAMAFLPNIENKPYIDHINGIRDDNRVENLKWCTQKENMNNHLTKEKISKSTKGENSPIARKVICITTGEIFISITQASEKYKVNRRNISQCCLGKRNYVGKNEEGESLVWRYLEDYLEGDSYER